MIQAILFDIGGTLRFIRKVKGRDQKIIKEMMGFLGYAGDSKEFILTLEKREEAYRMWCEKSLIELNEADLWTQYMLPEQPHEFIRENAISLNQFWRDSRGTRFVRADMVSTIVELARRGYKLGIISNTTSSVEVPQLIREYGIEQYFSTVILSCVYGRKKPHPSIFLEASRQMGIPLSQCAYVGDRESRDLIGSREAGMGEVVIIEAEGIQPEDRKYALRPDHAINQLNQLLDLYLPLTESLPYNSAYEPAHIYNVALSTMWNVKQPDFGASFADAARVGFPRVELNHQIPPDLLEQIDLHRFRIGSLHDPCPAVISMDDQKERDWLVSSTDENNRREGVEIAKRTIDLAVELNAVLVVIHPGSIPGSTVLDKELRKLYRAGLKGTPEYASLKHELMADRASRAPEHLEAVIRSMSEIADYASSTGIRIGMENRYRYYDIPILDEMESLLDVCGEDWFGFQYDVGHAQTLHQLGLCDHEEWLKRYSQRIMGVHLHDVIGIDDHQAPGTGDVDFAMISRYLPKTAYLTLEVNHRLSLIDLKSGLDNLTQFGIIERV